MPGTARIITLIARDEAQHKFITQNILRIWSNGVDDPEMKEIFIERQEIARKNV